MIMIYAGRFRWCVGLFVAIVVCCGCFDVVFSACFLALLCVVVVIWCVVAGVRDWIAA